MELEPGKYLIRFRAESYVASRTIYVLYWVTAISFVFYASIILACEWFGLKVPIICDTVSFGLPAYLIVFAAIVLRLKPLSAKDKR